MLFNLSHRPDMQTRNRTPHMPVWTTITCPGQLASRTALSQLTSWSPAEAARHGFRFLFPCKATLACTCTATCFQPTCQTHRQPCFRPHQLPAHQTPTRASLPHACRSHPLPVHPTPGCLPCQPTCSRPTETYATNLKISFPMQDHVHVECISRW